MKIKKCIIGLSVSLLALVAISVAQEEDGSNTITQGEAACIIANKLGLYEFLPASPSGEECSAILLANGISPFEGWELDKELSVGDFAKVLVEAMGRVGEVEGDLDSPESYVNFLKKLNISIESVSDNLDDLQTLREPKDPGISDEISATDDLKNRPIIGEPDERSYGADASSITPDLTDDAGTIRNQDAGAEEAPEAQAPEAQAPRRAAQAPVQRREVVESMREMTRPPVGPQTNVTPN